MGPTIDVLESEEVAEQCWALPSIGQHLPRAVKLSASKILQCALPRTPDTISSRLPWQISPSRLWPGVDWWVASGEVVILFP